MNLTDAINKIIDETLETLSDMHLDGEAIRLTLAQRDSLTITLAEVTATIITEFAINNDLI